MSQARNLWNQLESILCEVEKPARYAGGEYNSVVKDWDKTDLHFTFCFPDLYEIGMSHLGIKILYDILNRREDIWAERAFMVAQDMEDKLLKHHIPLYSLESKMPLKDADVIGFEGDGFARCRGILVVAPLVDAVPAVGATNLDKVHKIVSGGFADSLVVEFQQSSAINLAAMWVILVIVNPRVPVVITGLEEDERLVLVQAGDVHVTVVGVPSQENFSA